MKTAHALALADVVADQEPPDAQFDHIKSGRRYRVYRADGQLWHAESHVRADGSEVKLSEYPVRYVVGSGRFARTYLVEADGFLVESPVTWFGARNAWGMSPGYDEAEHYSFHRLILPECLYCHMGAFHTSADSRYRLQLSELAIGCERCHGPGAAHVARYGSREHQTSSDAPAIVNPSKLTRALSEAICSDCHLSSQASARATGTAVDDYRPGLPLRDFRHEYRFDAGESQMTVTGHVEQLRLSRCYQESETLTCITCHDPHNPHDSSGRDQRIKDNQAVCLKCHSAGDGDACVIPLTERLQHSSENDCTRCHMPQGPTDLLHFAFTHHRIGIHEENSLRQPDPVGAPLVPLDDLSHLSQRQRDRSRGLACYDLYRREAAFDVRYQTYLDRAEELLGAAYQAGLTDADVAAALALVACERGQWTRAIELANRVLAADPSRASRDDALFALAQAHFQNGRHREAVAPLRLLTKYRRSPQEWFMLGLCEQQLGREDRAIEALEQAQRIDPGVGLTHRVLSSLYLRRGDRDKAQHHLRSSQLLPESGFPGAFESPEQE